MALVQKSAEASVDTIMPDHREKHNASSEVGLEIVVRWTELDVNGHVNNVKCLEYPEWGRHEWCDPPRLRIRPPEEPRSDRGGVER